MMHPIAQSLSVHARRSCRLEPGGAIKDQRDRQQTPALHRVATLRRESTQIRCRMIPQRDLHRGAHLVLPPPGAANRRVGKSQPYFRGCGNPGVEGLDESQHPGRLVLHAVQPTFRETGSRHNRHWPTLGETAWSVRWLKVAGQALATTLGNAKIALALYLEFPLQNNAFREINRRGRSARGGVGAGKLAADLQLLVGSRDRVKHLLSGAYLAGRQ